MILCSYVVQCTPACSDTSCVKKKCALQSGFRSFICLGDPLPRDRLGPKELACPGAVGDNVEQRVCRGSKAPSSARARPPLNAGRVRATLPAEPAIRASGPRAPRQIAGRCCICRRGWRRRRQRTAAARPQVSYRLERGGGDQDGTAGQAAAPTYRAPRLGPSGAVRIGT